MAKPITVPMSPGITVDGNYKVRFTALDPDTGATVTGITVSLATILGDDVEPTFDTPKPVALPGTAFAFGDEAA